MKNISLLIVLLFGVIALSALPTSFGEEEHGDNKPQPQPPTQDQHGQHGQNGQHGQHGQQGQHGKHGDNEHHGNDEHHDKDEHHGKDEEHKGKDHDDDDDDDDDDDHHGNHGGHHEEHHGGHEEHHGGHSEDSGDHHWGGWGHWNDHHHGNFWAWMSFLWVGLGIIAIGFFTLFVCVIIKRRKASQYAKCDTRSSSELDSSSGSTDETPFIVPSKEFV